MSQTVRSGTWGRPSTKHAVLRDGPLGHRYYSIIYAIEAQNLPLIKFGRTSNMEKRFQSLASTSPVVLKLIGHLWMPDNTEQHIHDHLRDHRSHGEWFHTSPEVLIVAGLISASKHEELLIEIGF